MDDRNETRGRRGCGASDAADKTEVHEIVRPDGCTLTLSVTYTPRGSLSRRMYRLFMEVTAASEGCSPKVFVYHRATKGAPMEDGSPRDEFLCVADELDDDEIPVDKPDMERRVPYYRVATLELLFRNPDLMYETARSIIASLHRRP